MKPKVRLQPKPWVVPEIIARGSQQNTVGLDGTTLYQKNNIEQGSALPEGVQAAHQAVEVAPTLERLSVRKASLFHRTDQRPSVLSHDKPVTFGFHPFHLPGSTIIRRFLQREAAC